jgi:hypothetical protein
MEIQSFRRQMALRGRSTREYGNVPNQELPNKINMN